MTRAAILALAVLMLLGCSTSRGDQVPPVRVEYQVVRVPVPVPCQCIAMEPPSFDLPGVLVAPGVTLAEVELAREHDEAELVRFWREAWAAISRHNEGCSTGGPPG